jgi:tetratricopeptide (TPR) repeat protein
MNGVAVESREYLGREISLGLALLAARNLREAAPLLRSIAERAPRLLGSTHPSALVIQSDNALAMALLGQVDAALLLANQTVARLEGSASPQRVHALVIRGAVERLAGDFDAAIETLSGVLAIQSGNFRDNDQADAHIHLGLALLDAARVEEAAVRLRSGLDLLERISYGWSPLKADAVRALSQIRRG